MARVSSPWAGELERIASNASSTEAKSRGVGTAVTSTRPKPAECSACSSSPGPPSTTVRTIEGGGEGTRPIAHTTALHTEVYISVSTAHNTSGKTGTPCLHARDPLASPLQDE